MPIQPSIRATTPATAGDAAPAASSDATGLADLFNALVAGVAGPDAQHAASAATAEASPDAAPKPAKKPTNDAAASVEQLLAVADGKPAPMAPQAKAKGSEEKQDREASDAASTSLLPSLQTAAPVPPVAVPLQAPVTVPLSPVPAEAPSAIEPPTTAMVSAAASQKPAGVAPLTINAPVGAAPAQARSQARSAITPQKPSAPADTAPATDVDVAAAPPPKDSPQTAAAPQKATPPAQSPTNPVQAAVTTLLANIGGTMAQRSSQTERTRSASSPIPAVVAAMKPVDQPTLPSTPPPSTPNVQPADGAAAAQPLQGLVIERQLDLAHQQDWIDQLARDISNAAGGDGKTLRFHLNPEHLGTLQVEISQSHHGAAVRISADTEAARTIIADAQPRLLAEARAQGVRISEAHVDFGSNGSSDPRRQAAALSDEAQVRTARSLQEESGDDGKPTPSRRDLYA